MIDDKNIQTISPCDINPRDITILDTIIAENLMTARKNAGLSRKALCKPLNISQQQLCKYENAVNRIPAARLYLLSKVLNVDINYFYRSPLLDTI